MDRLHANAAKFSNCCSVATLPASDQHAVYVNRAQRELLSENAPVVHRRTLWTSLCARCASPILESITTTVAIKISMWTAANA